MSIAGMLSAFAAQTRQPAQLSESQRGLINQTGRAFGGLLGGYKTPNPTDSASAMDAAMQAQKYGHMQDYATYMDQSKQFQQQEATAALQDKRLEAQKAEAAVQRAWQSGQNEKDRALQKYGVDVNNATRKEVSLMEAGFAYERLAAQLRTQEGLQAKRIESEMKRAKAQMEQMWKIAGIEEKGRMARAMLDFNASASNKKMPDKSDLEALAILAKGLPDEVQNKLGVDDWIGGDKKTLQVVSKVYDAVMAGEDPVFSMQALAAGGTWTKEGGWE